MDRNFLLAVVLSMLVVTLWTSQQQRREPALAAIKREGERTSRLAASLLLLAQADAGQKLELRPVEMDEVLSDAYEQAQERTNGLTGMLKHC